MGGRGGSGRSIAAPAAPTVVAEAPIDQILNAMRNAARQVEFGGKLLVGMYDLRQQLSKLGWDRERQDAELIKASRARQLILAPAVNQKLLLQRDRDATVRLGGEDKGIVMQP